MIVYSIPFLTGVNMGIEQFGELYKNPKVLGVKFTAGDFYLLERLKKLIQITSFGLVLMK